MSTTEVPEFSQTNIFSNKCIKPNDESESPLEQEYSKIVHIIECLNNKIDNCKHNYFILLCKGRCKSSTADLCRKNVEMLSVKLKKYAKRAALLQAQADESKGFCEIPLATSLVEDFMGLGNSRKSNS